jgi:hypothetical protein
MASLVMLGTLATVAVNFLAATGRINGVMPDEVSNRYPTVITPAGWAFSIWGLIYTGLIAFSIFQLLPSRIGVFGRVRVPYLVSCVLNCAWLLLWHHFQIGSCTLVIALLLGSLFWVNVSLERPTSFLESTLTKGVFGLYAGWVTVATLVNLLVYFVYAGVDWSNDLWNVVGISCLVLALLATIAVRLSLKNFIYPLSVAWATAAIGASQSGKSTAIVVTTALICIGCLIVAGTVVTELKGSTT